MKWPEGIKVGACLTFDVDGPLIWRSKVRVNPKFGNPVCVSLGEFGPVVGVPRILKLLKKYDLKAGFFIPGATIDEYPEMVRQVHEEGHEIGFHSYGHVNPSDLTYDQEKEDFEKGLELFDKVIQSRPLGYRSPALDMSENTWRLLVDYGFIYNSAMMDNDVPYLHHTHGKSMVEIPIHWMLDDWVYFGFNMYPSLPYMSGISSQEKVFQIWSAEFDGIYREGRHFVLCMHPQLMGRLSRLDMLEKLIMHIKQKPKVWIAKPIDVARYVLASQGRGNLQET
jgi:peptidoglycan/xylan/chitin deacetylase (PgdA/CDA1 family)